MRIRRLLFPLALVATASPALAQGESLSLLGYHATVPSSWTSRTPASSMRLAEFIVSSSSKDTAEVVVYFFGKGQGGSVDANLVRWKAQFSSPDGSPVPETIVRDSAGPFPITIAEFRGNYQRGVGAGSADSVRIGQTLVAGIVETPRGTLFIQLFGNSARVSAAKPTFLAFVRTLH